MPISVFCLWGQVYSRLGFTNTFTITQVTSQCLFHVFVSERDAINTHSGSTGINLDHPGQTRTCGHPTNKKRAAETGKGKQPSLYSSGILSISRDLHIHWLARFLHPLFYTGRTRIIITLIEGQANWKINWEEGAHVSLVSWFLAQCPIFHRSVSPPPAAWQSKARSQDGMVADLWVHAYFLNGLASLLCALSTGCIRGPATPS